MLNGLDLFSGIGGNSLALRPYIRTRAYCEQDRHAQAVLLSRMGDGSLPPAPIWDDVSTLTGHDFDIPIDIIVAGFPCQDISVAGNGAGLAGKRSGLVFEVFRLVGEIRPQFVFLENVPAIRTRGGERVVKELATLGYDCRWDCLSAYDVGAPHKRERWFLLGYSGSRRCDEPKTREMEQPRGAKDLGASHAMADTYRLRELQPEKRECEERGRSRNVGEEIDHVAWPAEPTVGRVVDGLPMRVDRIKRLGNAVVPAQAREAFERLIGIR